MRREYTSNTSVSQNASRFASPVFFSRQNFIDNTQSSTGNTKSKQKYSNLISYYQFYPVYHSTLYMIKIKAQNSVKCKYIKHKTTNKLIWLYHINQRCLLHWLKNSCETRRKYKQGSRSSQWCDLRRLGLLKDPSKQSIATWKDAEPKLRRSLDLATVIFLHSLIATSSVEALNCRQDIITSCFQNKDHKTLMTK